MPVLLHRRPGDNSKGSLVRFARIALLSVDDQMASHGSEMKPRQPQRHFVRAFPVAPHQRHISLTAQRGVAVFPACRVTCLQRSLSISLLSDGPSPLARVSTVFACTIGQNSINLQRKQRPRHHPPHSNFLRTCSAASRLHVQRRVNYTRAPLSSSSPTASWTEVEEESIAHTCAARSIAGKRKMGCIHERGMRSRGGRIGQGTSSLAVEQQREEKENVSAK
ncbi:uncharacterized protein IWZ02DRAFT_52223 [Phyllosticta citriasiana]|uniref:uncharacterized protein n=1 Tax=Phyllosticta citriasiana TaxID=595635 RepID=UPI0030FD4E26